MKANSNNICTLRGSMSIHSVTTQGFTGKFTTFESLCFVRPTNSECHRQAQWLANKPTFDDGDKKNFAYFNLDNAFNWKHHLGARAHERLVLVHAQLPNINPTCLIFSNVLIAFGTLFDFFVYSIRSFPNRTVLCSSVSSGMVL